MAAVKRSEKVARTLRVRDAGLTASAKATASPPKLQRRRKGLRHVRLALLVPLMLVTTDAAAQPIPQQTARPAAAQGIVRDAQGQPVSQAVVSVIDAGGRAVATATTDVEGVFRVRLIPPGTYDVGIRRDPLEPFVRRGLRLGAGEVALFEITLQGRLPPPPSAASPAGAPRRPGEPGVVAEPISGAPYRVLPRAETAEELAAVEALPPGEHVFVPMPDRWNIVMPDWDRYGQRGEYPYVGRRWWDPFNRNPVKGDYPVIGDRTFFTFTGISDSLLEGRSLPTPSGVSGDRAGNEPFFGRGEQYFPVTAFRFAFDLFRGDTAFRPIDWRVRVQPAISVNYLNTQERGVVNPDVRRGATRVDSHVGLQEAFVEKKLLDLSPNYDFVSVRVGIQELSTDFRGFLAVVEQPGVRVFGNLKSNRVEYNLAFFDFLEKDTNSGFNELKRRGQQMAVANVYVQDFLTLGYTTQFSVHFNKDDASIHYDRNNFLVRPAPIGLIRPHDIRAYYVGWTGNGHIGRMNISHAFYHAFGHDNLNPIAAQRIDINANMAAAELSIDKDWLRIKGAFFWASGDDDPNDDEGRGFDAIVDIPVFAGGPFSVWNRQALRLTQTGTGIVSPLSLLPSLRTSKDEGQANFVNPGVFIVYSGLDVELTPKMRGFVNTSYLRFHHTEPLETLLFQSPVRPNIGIDYSVGVQYRPPLSDNIVLVGGVAGMGLMQGLRDIYTREHFVSLFANLRLQF